MSISTKVRCDNCYRMEREIAEMKKRTKKEQEKALKFSILLRMKAQDGLWIPGQENNKNGLHEAADLLENFARQE